MIKILLGGSPCTYWSVCQRPDKRETVAEGVGWELFKNYLIAKDKFKPDIFLYENNKSASQAIKDQIKAELGVIDGDAQYIEIDSALVSAQSRKRFYVHNCGDVQQPEDRGIKLIDILESGIVDREKSYCLKHQAGNARDYLKKHHTQVAFEPVRIGDIGTNGQGHRVYSPIGKSIALKANSGGQGGKTGLYAVPLNTTMDGKARTIRATCYKDGFRNMIGNDIDRKTCVAIPVIPLNTIPDGKSRTIKAQYSHNSTQNFCHKGSYGATGVAVEVEADNADKNSPKIHSVKDGKITYNGKAFDIDLPDGDYIIRKLTPTECERLQTLPDGYTRGGQSDTQRYKGLGNGWTAEVIIHILSEALKDVPRDEKILVLSMYDGIGTGRYCLDKMGFTNIEYHAYEIDKYAIQMAMTNYPDIIQHGDAFQIRENIPTNLATNSN